MKVLVIYAHPNPDSFNHAILQTLQDSLQDVGHEVRMTDLYAEDFDPVLDRERLAQMSKGEVPYDVEREQQDLLWAEALVFIYPLWWCDRPAILKGWFDRVLTNGFAFKYTEAGPQGLLQHRKVLIIITAGGDTDSYKGLGGDQFVSGAISDGTLRFCGITNIETKIFYGVPIVSVEERQAMLEEVNKLGAAF